MEVYVAQWITHQTSNLGIVGSSPIIDFRIANIFAIVLLH